MIYNLLSRRVKFFFNYKCDFLQFDFKIVVLLRKTITILLLYSCIGGFGEVFSSILLYFFVSESYIFIPCLQSQYFKSRN